MLSVRRLLMIFFLYVSALLSQRLFVDEIKIVGISADILTIAVVIFVSHFGLVKGVCFGFMVGLSYDLINGIIGAQAFSKVIIAFLTGFLIDEISHSRIKLQRVLITLFFLASFETVIKVMMYNILDFRSYNVVILQILASGLINVLVAFVIIKTVPSLRDEFS